jgi:NTE family protein
VLVSCTLILGVAGTAIVLRWDAGPKLQNDFAASQYKKNTEYSARYEFSNWLTEAHVSLLSPDLIIVTFSGGGIRAAALAAATIEELRKFTINGKSLTNNIVLVSSTSGGSIAAGYMAAHGFDQYERFRESFLSNANTRDLIISGLGPRLFNDRSGVMSDFLEKRLDLDGLTFEELMSKKDRPFFLFNATDLSSGEPFHFSQLDLDLICTDVNKLPISSGMTASAAIPFLLTDVEFQNRWDSCNMDKSHFDPSTNVLNPAEDMKTSRARYNYVHAFDGDADSPRPRPKILHLADGGLADNLAIRALFSQIDVDVLGSISGLIKSNGGVSSIRQVLVLEINARNEEPKTYLDSSRGSPGLLKMLFLTSGIPIDQTSALSANYARTEFGSAITGGAYVNSGILHAQIDFDMLPDSEEALRNRVKSIGMGLTLKPDELRDIEKASAILLRQNACFSRFIGQSGAKTGGYVLPPSKGGTGWPYNCMSLTDHGAS